MYLVRIRESGHWYSNGRWDIEQANATRLTVEQAHAVVDACPLAAEIVTEGVESLPTDYDWAERAVTAEAVIEAAREFYNAWLADSNHNNEAEVYVMGQSFGRTLDLYDKSKATYGT